MKRMLTAVALAASVVSQGAWAADRPALQYPTKPVRVIVPVTTGGGSDLLARMVAQVFTERFGHSFIVDNRAGAGGIIGSELVAKATPDGYTLIVAYTASHGINPAIKQLPYDPIRDFAPISLLGTAPNVLVVHPSVPAKSVKELIAYIKGRADRMVYASAGVGSAPHLAAEMFKYMSGLDMAHVPYKGASPAVTDVVGGQVPMIFASMPATLPLVRAGRLRALAVTSRQRAAAAPELPTVAESGLPGFDVIQWYTLLAPAKTPGSIIAVLNAEVLRMMKLPDIREKLMNQGLEPGGSTPEQVNVYVADEISKWKKLIRATGLKLE